MAILIATIVVIALLMLLVSGVVPVSEKVRSIARVALRFAFMALRFLRRRI